MGYRMLVTDLDYTCLNDDHVIPEDNIKAAKRAIEEGLIFSVATGRSKAAAERHVLQLAPNAPVILQNGMSIYDFNENRTIIEHLVDTEMSIMAIEWGDSKGIITAVAIGDRHYISKRGGEMVEALEKLEGVPCVETGDLKAFIESEKETVKIANVLYVVRPEDRDKLARQAVLDFPEVSVIVSGPPFIEFLNKEASKGHALEELCAIIGVDLSEVVVVGDAPNDAEMMMRAGMSYAVANAEDKVKGIAQRMTKRGHNDAVLPEVLLDAFGINV
ncbi:MAG TPA: Cof-type HAD-IIB family hydrolase [Bacillota bacterium]|nr:Cof-type HAD-IIB family hydrolase [Bacillota bacterium]HOH10567.1 Cof-type HAD-IIB family hydrolase [Bacillota bacterium]HPI02157.1 Cof-type HAD-IIB family hydrolase [Bacillota bacterium]HPM64053.1 Cof-type HAD-IIB family hydrolase [Bacillota bacterium]HQJ23833.1 Cof-type HAD-IIB family hydrolase [Bacillota bacterium]